MKKGIVIAAALGAILGYGAFVYAQDAPAASQGPKPEKGMVIGLCVAIPYYAMTGATGENAVEAMKYEIEKGFPVGVIDEQTGEVWVMVWRDSAPASPMTTANAQFKDYAGMKVSVQGLKYKANGVNVMRASLVSEY